MEKPSRTPKKVGRRIPYTWSDGTLGFDCDVGDYQVCVRFDWLGAEPKDRGTYAMLQICRSDGGSVFDWRDMQAIKTLVLGAEWSAVEVFPPESMLKDPSNARYLWASNKPMPFGLPGGRLLLSSADAIAPQRPFDWEGGGA